MNEITESVPEQKEEFSDPKRQSVVVWTNGTYKFVEGSTWEYEHDSDWLVTIPIFSPIE